MLTISPLLNLHFPFWVFVLAGSVTSFLLTYITIPTIVKISEFKGLFDFPDERKSHSRATPVLGGLAIFVGFSISSILFSLPSDSGFVRYLLGGMIILMLIGLKDDILIIDPKKKILGQIIASLIVVILGDIRITDFQNILGIGQISYIFSVSFSVLLIAFFIVSFNFIDGVDGLASGIAIIASLFYGTWFLLTDNYTSAIPSFSIAASLMAFFRFNVFSKKNKIFLGDAGAMITGLMIGVLTIQFIEFKQFAPSGFQFNSTPCVSIGLLFIPIFDTIRVFIIRIIDGALFKSGKNHIHHIILSMGNSHISTTLFIISGNMLLFVCVLLLQKTGNNFLLAFISIVAVILYIFLQNRFKRYK